MLASSRRPCAAAMSAGGPWPSPTNHGKRPANRNGSAHPGGRRAGCPHPAAPRAATNPRGRDKSRPYGQILCFEPTGMAPPTRAAVGRDALIPPHPAPPRTPAGGYGIRPYNQRQARGQPGNRCPCVIINLCRGRCLHRPGGPYAARTPAGGINPAPTTNGGRAACRETAVLAL